MAPELKPAREFTVTLGGRELPLRYDVFGTDVEEMEDEFRRPDGTPGSILELAREHLLKAGSLKVQVALLWYGVRHNKGLTRDQVRRWYLQHTQDGGKRGDLLLPVWRALVVSGVLGFIGEIEEPEEGKATPADPNTPVRAAE